MQLINNGYVVQDLNYLIFDQDSYNGVQKFKSWPLRKYNDNESLMLEDFAWKKWFAYHGCFETVPDVKFIKKYINHCNHLGIEIRLLQIESPTKYMETSNTLSIKKVLGFDCVAGIELSYLCMPNQDLKKFFPISSLKVNTNGLFDRIEDLYEFLSYYHKLVNDGINLENWGDPVPIKISEVYFEDK